MWSQAACYPSQRYGGRVLILMPAGDEFANAHRRHIRPAEMMLAVAQKHHDDCTNVLTGANVAGIAPLATAMSASRPFAGCG